ncbi:unnamed protein product [Brassicogethes aeneus]|uniref:SUEL-type lectin domain-containing protein n=1 Tax=Brassicogethes aeneus TaxID=1431903 RepID=A0A9P0B6J1_BRAAE|nr:unnamed protein product [Brassicogethes aeneus]
MWQLKLCIYLCLTLFGSSCYGSGGFHVQTTCENEETDLFSCELFEKDSVLYISNLTTFWGRRDNTTCAPIENDKDVKANNWNCHLDIVDLLRKKCDGKTRCKFQSSNEFFGGDPCPGDRKYSVVSYECRKPAEPTPPTATEPEEPTPPTATEPEEPTPPTPTEPAEEVVQGPTVCYTNYIRIDCGQKKIKTNKVFFGRGDSSTCKYFSSNFNNLKCDASDVAYKDIQQKCDGQNHCYIWNILGFGGVSFNANLNGSGLVSGNAIVRGNVNAQISCTPAHLPYLKISHQCVN